MGKVEKWDDWNKSFVERLGAASLRVSEIIKTLIRGERVDDEQKLVTLETVVQLQYEIEKWQLALEGNEDQHQDLLAQLRNKTNHLVALKEKLGGIGITIAEVVGKPLVQREGARRGDSGEFFDVMEWRRDTSAHPDEARHFGRLIEKVGQDLSREEMKASDLHRLADTFVFEGKQYASPSDAIKQLRDGLETLINILAAGDRVERQKAVVLREQYIKKAEGLLQQLEEVRAKGVPKESPQTVTNREERVIVESLEKFFKQRGIPLREDKEEYADLEKYLDAMHRGIVMIATITVWNELHDKADEPRTVSYLKEPMFGPAKEIALLGQTLTYDQDQDMRVRSLEALLDQLHYYFPQQERQRVKEFAERMKNLFREVSTWHNRARVRRQDIAANKAGPDQALVELGQIVNKPGLSPQLETFFDLPDNATEREKLFSEAVEFCMAVWSAFNLKQHERQRLWNLIDPNVKQFFDVVSEFGEQRYHIKSEYDIVPLYRGTVDQRRAMVEKMVSMVEGMGLSKMEAQLAYHIGETYRIGAGLEAYMDVSYKRGQKKNDAASNVSVQAQWGEPKAACIGPYVESAWGNPQRPDFNIIFKDYLVHGYPPYSRASQYSHKITDERGRVLDISGFGDDRATLAELLAIKGGVKKIRWDTGSSNPDKVVHDAASQATPHWWPSSSIKKGAESFFIDIRSIPLATNVILDRSDETHLLAQEFGFYGRTIQRISKTVGKVTLRPDLGQYEQFGFHSESTPISGERNQALRSKYKDSRDYWLNSFKADTDRYPTDFMRLMGFLFSRDDTPSNYVNNKIAWKIHEARQVPLGQRKEWVNEKFYPWMQGYLTYDWMLRAVFYLLKPDFRSTPSLSGTLSQGKLREMYRELNFANYENIKTSTIGGGLPLNVAQIQYVINQAMLPLDHFPETAKIEGTPGYRLYDDYDEDTGVIYDHEDLLRLAGEFNIGEGYEYELVQNQMGEEFMQLRRTNEGPTIQWIIDRLVLLLYLFKRSDLKLQGK